MKSTGFAVTLLLILCCFAWGQSKQTPQSQTAITKDGRNVILNSDGTWKYAESAVAGGLGNLTAQAAVVMKSGDVKPIARIQFVLLKKSAVEIAQQQGLQQKGSSMAFALSLELTVMVQQAEAMNRFSAELLKQVVAKGETDFNGKLEMKDLPPGDYYLFGYTSIGRSSILWDLPVKVVPGSNSIILDQKNAASAV